MENSRPTAEWMRAYQKAVNSDPEMGVVGDWFSTDFKISFEGVDFLISVREGKIVENRAEPALRSAGRLYSARADVCLEQIHQPQTAAAVP